MQDFSYDPFDPAVMADPLPYYRVLREHYPVYYLDKWDTFALSRFADIWDVLAVNDGTFVASEGTLPPASTLGHHNDGPVGDPPWHPLPFTRPSMRRSTTASGRRTASRSGRKRPRNWRPGSANLPTSVSTAVTPRGTFDLTQEYGGIVAASVVCEFLGIPVDLASEVLASVNAGSLAEPGSGVDTAQSRPNYLDYLIPSVKKRRANTSDNPLPVVDGLMGYRLPDSSALDDVEVATQMLCVFIGGTETVPKIVAHGLWELLRHPDQLAAVRADPKANVPVAREEMIRYCAPAQWFARTARKPFTIHDTTIEPGQRIVACSHRPTATSASTRNRTNSSGTGPFNARWRSAGASASVWATTSLVWRLPS